jgi:serine/threonine-protein kinase
VKVLDFGIVKAEARLTNTTAGVVKGKYMYMSPEQARSGEVDRRADIFSLGVSLYEALTNVRPFSRDSDLAVLNAVLNGDFKKPRELRPDLSPELERVVLKAMAVRIDDRYQSALEMAFELEQFLGSGPAGVGPAQVASYVQTLCGVERVTGRTRIPTLATLAPAGIPQSRALTPTEPGAFTVDVEVLTPTAPAGNRETQVQRRLRSHSKVTPVRASPWRPLLMGLAVGSALAAAGIVGYVRLFRHARGAPPVAIAAPLALPPPAPAVGPPAELPSPAPPPERVATAVASPVHSEAPPPRPVRPVAPRPIELGLPDIQRVVSRDRALVMGCFQTYKDELPSDSGQVTVQFSILASGKVSTAEAQGPLAGTGVGKCLEQRVSRLKFPVHRDKEVTLALPFEYRVAR